MDNSESTLSVALSVLGNFSDARSVSLLMRGVAEIAIIAKKGSNRIASYTAPFEVSGAPRAPSITPRKRTAPTTESRVPSAAKISQPSAMKKSE